MRQGTVLWYVLHNLSVFFSLGMRTCHVFIATLCFVSLELLGQVGLPVYSQYMLDNYYTIVPAVSGTSPCTKIRLGHRYQWTGLEDAPALSSVSYQGKLTENMGLGVLGFYDVNGYSKQTGVQTTISYTAFIQERYLYIHQLSFGISYMGINYKIDQKDFGQQNGNVFILDPLIQGAVRQRYIGDFNISASYIFAGFISAW